MGKNAVLNPLPMLDVPGRSFCESERLSGAILSISENLRSKCQRSSSPHAQIWAESQFWIHNCIQIYQAATFVNVGWLLSTLLPRYITVPYSTISDTTRSCRGPGILTSGRLARKRKQKKVKFLLKLCIFDI